MPYPATIARRHNYEIEGFGEFRPLALNDDELNALGFLLRTFDGGVPNGEHVVRLLARIRDMLTQGQQHRLTHQGEQFQLNLRYRDEEQVDEKVKEVVAKSIHQRRQLQFAYRTAGQIDSQPRIHTVMPFRQRFDAQRGHLYLDAYWLQSDGPLGQHSQKKWQPFRMDKIVADEHLRVLPEKLPPTLPRRPRFGLDYWLSPQIARLGHISRHFDAMQVHETDADGWVRVTGSTDDLFRACRLLLGYGPNCRVVGGDEAQAEMVKMVRAMGEVYFSPESGRPGS